MQNDTTPLTEAQQLALDIGRRLHWVRQVRGQTLAQLGLDLGVNGTLIRHIESGRRGPSVPLIASMCHVLRITPQYLFYGDVRDIDPELRRALLVAHPELRSPSQPRFVGKRSTLDRTNAPRPKMALSPH